MATVTKSLNSLYKEAMHRPITIDNFTLYTKADGYSGTIEGESQAEKSQNYLKHCNSNYNSPTNIRKVFITGKGIAVQYYATPVTAKGTGHHWNWTSYKDTNLFDIAMKIMTYSADLAKYNMSKAAGIKADEPKRYKISGNSLGIISHPWVCSNIEEIYFDWTMLMSNEMAPYFRDFCTVEGYQAFITKTEQPMEQQYAGIQQAFEAFNMGGTKDLRKRFPRLRTIAMISKLQDILDAENVMTKVDLKFNNLKESTESWYKANKDLVVQSGSVVLYCDLSSQLQFPNKEFVIKSNQYKFDFDKLEGIVNAYKIKVNDAARLKYGSSTEPENNNIEDEIEELNADFELCDVEKRCLEIEQQYGEKVLTNSLLFAVKGSGIPLSQIKKIFEQFSKPNRIRMAKSVGFTDMK